VSPTKELFEDGSSEGLSGLNEKRGKATGPQKGRPRKNPLSLEEEE
jgi:transposase